MQELRTSTKFATLAPIAADKATEVTLGSALSRIVRLEREVSVLKRRPISKAENAQPDLTVSDAATLTADQAVEPVSYDLTPSPDWETWTRDIKARIRACETHTFFTTEPWNPTAE